MNLSEVCLESIERLVDHFHNTLDWDYRSDYYDQYIHAMQLLADIAYQFDAVNELIECEEEIGVDREEFLREARHKGENFVIEKLMQGEPEDSYAVFTLANVILESPRVRELIAGVKDWRKSPAGVSEILKQETPVEFDAWYRAIEKEVKSGKSRESCR